MKYLDEKLALLNALLVKENLNRYGLGRGSGAGRGPVTEAVSLQGAGGPLGAALAGHSAGAGHQPGRLCRLLQPLPLHLGGRALWRCPLCWAAGGKAAALPCAPLPQARCTGLPGLDSPSSKHPQGSLGQQHLRYLLRQCLAAGTSISQASGGFCYDRCDSFWCDRWLCPGLLRPWRNANSRLHLSWSSVPSTSHSLTPLPSCPP